MTGNTAALIIETESLRPEGGGAPLFEGYRWGGRDGEARCFA